MQGAAGTARSSLRVDHGWPCPPAAGSGPLSSPTSDLRLCPGPLQGGGRLLNLSWNCGLASLNGVSVKRHQQDENTTGTLQSVLGKCN